MKGRILTLLREPSTFAGIAAALGGLGVAGLSEDLWLTIFGALAAVAGAIAAVTLDPADKGE